MEERRRRLAPIEHQLIARVESRRIAATVGERNTTTLARRVLRVGAGEAKARVSAAEALGPRSSLLGERLEPIYPIVAAAQAVGTVSEAAARLIVTTIEQLPDAVRAEVDRDVERTLTEQAGVLDLDQLRTLARHVTALLDPDGLLCGPRNSSVGRERRARTRILARVDDDYASAGTQPRWWVRQRPLPWWRRWLDRRLAQADVAAPDGTRFHVRVLRAVPLRDSPLGPFDSFVPQHVSLAVLVGANLSARRRTRWLLQVLRAETPWRAPHVIYTRKVRGGSEVADLAIEVAAAIQRGEIPFPASGNDHIRRTVKKIMNWD